MIIILKRKSNASDWDKIDILVNLDNMIKIEPTTLREKGSTLTMIENSINVHESVEEINEIILSRL